MFTAKQKTLLSPTANQTSDSFENAFVKAGLKESSKTTKLGNGAVKFTTTNNDFVDDFGKISNYRKPRTYAEVNQTMTLLWSQNKLLTVCLLFYIRMITRIVTLFDGVRTTTSQRGQGLKHEGNLRMLWLSINQPEVFWNNIRLFISIGSWKDIIQMLSYDLQFNGWKNRKLDWDNFGKLILIGLENPNTSELVKKYLPQIKSNSQCKTLEAQADNLISKWVCSLLFGNKGDNTGWTYKQYRKLKTSGTAHQWQQLISKGKHSLIDFNTVHGRALAQMVSGKYLKNQGLEAKYQKWIESQPIAKFTGYVYELLSVLGNGHRANAINLKQYQIDTINKQFYSLVETAKNGMNNKSNLIVVVDTSGSMESLLPGTKVSAYSVAKSMALYFSHLLEGRFSGHWFEFTHTCTLKKWKGETPVEQYCNDNSSYVGGTNFQSIATEFIKIKQQGVAESEFPSGILCLSDGCFNNTRTNKTNTQALKLKLLQAGFSRDYVNNFKIVLWDVPNNYYGKPQTAFEEFADCPNLFYFSGLDGSAIAFLTGTSKQTTIPKNAKELFEAAMNQEVLNLIKL